MSKATQDPPKVERPEPRPQAQQPPKTPPPLPTPPEPQRLTESEDPRNPRHK